MSNRSTVSELHRTKDVGDVWYESFLSYDSPPVTCHRLFMKTTAATYIHLEGIYATEEGAAAAVKRVLEARKKRHEVHST